MKPAYDKPYYRVMPKDRKNIKLRQHGRVLERMATIHINTPEMQEQIRKAVFDIFPCGIIKVNYDPKERKGKI